MLAGYMSVSSLDQNPKRQFEELCSLRVMKIFMDIICRRAISISHSTTYRYIPMNVPKKN